MRCSPVTGTGLSAFGAHVAQTVHVAGEVIVIFHRGPRSLRGAEEHSGR